MVNTDVRYMGPSVKISACVGMRFGRISLPPQAVILE